MPANGDTYTADGITYVFDAATGRYKRANSNDLASHNHADQYSPLGHTHSTTGEPTNATTIAAAGGVLRTDTDPLNFKFVDGDGLMTANSNLVLPTQKAVRDYFGFANAFSVNAMKQYLPAYIDTTTNAAGLNAARPSGWLFVIWIIADGAADPTNYVAGTDRIERLDP